MSGIGRNGLAEGIRGEKAPWWHGIFIRACRYGIFIIRNIKIMIWQQESG